MLILGYVTDLVTDFAFTQSCLIVLFREVLPLRRKSYHVIRYDLCFLVVFQIYFFSGTLIQGLLGQYQRSAVLNSTFLNSLPPRHFWYSEENVTLRSMVNFVHLDGCNHPFNFVKPLFEHSVFCLQNVHKFNEFRKFQTKFQKVLSNDMLLIFEKNSLLIKCGMPYCQIY